MVWEEDYGGFGLWWHPLVNCSCKWLQLCFHAWSGKVFSLTLLLFCFWASSFFFPPVWTLFSTDFGRFIFFFLLTVATLSFGSQSFSCMPSYEHILHMTADWTHGHGNAMYLSFQIFNMVSSGSLSYDLFPIVFIRIRVRHVSSRCLYYLDSALMLYE